MCHESKSQSVWSKWWEVLQMLQRPVSTKKHITTRERDQLKDAEEHTLRDGKCETSSWPKMSDSLQQAIDASHMSAGLHEKIGKAPLVVAPRNKLPKNVDRGARGDVDHGDATSFALWTLADRGAREGRARLMSHHMQLFACLRMRRWRLCRLRRRAQASWANDGVELSGTSRALGMAMMGEARAGTAGSRVVGAGTASGRARERRVRPGGVSTWLPGPPSPRTNQQRTVSSVRGTIRLRCGWARAGTYQGCLASFLGFQFSSIAHMVPWEPCWSIVGDGLHVRSVHFLLNLLRWLSFLGERHTANDRRTIPLHNWMGAWRADRVLCVSLETLVTRNRAEIVRLYFVVALCLNHTRLCWLGIWLFFRMSPYFSFCRDNFSIPWVFDFCGVDVRWFQDDYSQALPNSKESSV